MNSDCVDVMIDLETLGKTPGCTILSIGATTFGTPDQDREKFYEKISTAKSYGLTVSSETVAWWHQQDPVARKEAFSGTKYLPDVLYEFSDYLGKLGKPPRVWGNSAAFDISILGAAYEICCIPVPWKYYDVMCYRTLKNLISVPAPVQNTQLHNALADAIYQAAHAEVILEKLKCQSD